jgi:excinuclease UvrABC ATPase subunit
MKMEIPKPICQGCDGRGVVDVNVNMGKYGCYADIYQCPMCKGTKYASEEDVDKFWRIFDYPTHHEKRE